LGRVARAVHRAAEGRVPEGARAARGEEGPAADLAEAGARQPAEDRLVVGLRAAEAEVPRPAAVPQLRPRGDRALRRLAAVLPDLGPARALAADPERRGRRRVGAPRLLGRPLDAAPGHRG